MANDIEEEHSFLSESWRMNWPERVQNYYDQYEEMMEDLEAFVGKRSSFIFEKPYILRKEDGFRGFTITLRAKILTPENKVRRVWYTPEGKWAYADSGRTDATRRYEQSYRARKKGIEDLSGHTPIKPEHSTLEEVEEAVRQADLRREREKKTE